MYSTVMTTRFRRGNCMAPPPHLSSYLYTSVPKPTVLKPTVRILTYRLSVEELCFIDTARCLTFAGCNIRYILVGREYNTPRKMPIYIFYKANVNYLVYKLTSQFSFVDLYSSNVSARGDEGLWPKRLMNKGQQKSLMKASGRNV